MRSTCIRFIACAALLTALHPRFAAADTLDRLTYFTFSGAVQLPGLTLEPGTYEFRLVNPATGGSVLRVSSQDQKVGKLFLILRTAALDDVPDDPIVVLRETPAGQPPAIQAWFYPGQETGFEFRYSHRQAQALGMTHLSKTTLAAANTHIVTGSSSQVARVKVR
jgi:hypothetical protein